MAKTSIDPKKKAETSRDSKKYTDFREKDKRGYNEQAKKAARSGSSGQYGGAAAPRVGSDKQKMPIAIPKPSRVQSGIKLSKKKK